MSKSPQQLHEVPEMGPRADRQRPLCEGGLRTLESWPALPAEPAGAMADGAEPPTLSLVHEAQQREAPRATSLDELEALADGDPVSFGGEDDESAPRATALADAEAALLALEDGALFEGQAPVRPVRLAPDRAPRVEHRIRRLQVIRDCADRMLQIARDRDRLPMRGRAKCERRLWAQVDAMVHVGAAAIAELRSWHGELGTADATWVWVFALANLEGREPLAAIVDTVNADWAPTTIERAAQAFAASPNPHHAPLARALIESQHDAATAMALHVASLRGVLPDADAVGWLTRGGPRTKAAALTGLSRSVELRRPPDAALQAVGDDDAEVAWQAARLCSRLGSHAAYAELRRGGELVAKLGPRAAEIYVMVGEPDDAERLQRMVSRYPITGETLDALARFGLPTAWSFLSHHLADPFLQASAADALAELFGDIADDPHDPFAWEDAIARASLDGSRRVRRGAPWTPTAVAGEWRDGELSAEQVRPRLDELAARAGLRRPVALDAWGERPTKDLEALASEALGSRGPRSGAWRWRKE